MILAGQGILQSGAALELRAVAEHADLPVALTLLGIGGFPASHPLCLGMMGMHGEAYVNEAIQRADLLLAFGMRFDDRVTGKLATYAPDARKIHVDIDPAELGKNVAADVPIRGDLRAVLAELLPLLPPGMRRGGARSTRGATRRASATSCTSPTAAACTRPTSFTTCGAPPPARRSSSPTWGSTRCGRRSTTRTSGRAP